MNRSIRLAWKGAALALAVVAVAAWLAPPTPAHTPYASALSGDGIVPAAIPHGCRQTICVQQADGTFKCAKQDGSLSNCKVSGGGTTCVNSADHC